MRQHILNTFPWLTPTWYYTRGFLTIVGATCIIMGMFHYGIALKVVKNGLFVSSIAFTLAIEALLLGWTLKLWFHNLGKGDTPKEIAPISSGEFDIKDSGDVIYDPIDELNDLKKADYSHDTWKFLASKYQGKDYRGNGWQMVRLYCLEQAKKAPSL